VDRAGLEPADADSVLWDCHHASPVSGARQPGLAVHRDLERRPPCDGLRTPRRAPSSAWAFQTAESRWVTASGPGATWWRDLPSMSGRRPRRRRRLRHRHAESLTGGPSRGPRRPVSGSDRLLSAGQQVVRRDVPDGAGSLCHSLRSGGPPRQIAPPSGCRKMTLGGTLNQSIDSRPSGAVCQAPPECFRGKNVTLGRSRRWTYPSQIGL
jgi:hypothetical protein